MHSHRHNFKTFDKPVGDTDWSKLVTCKFRIYCQSEWNGAGANHQSPDCWRVLAGVASHSCPCENKN